MTYNELKDILMESIPSKEIKKHEDEVFNLIPELKRCKGFNQNNPWHVYDVYEHILHVLDNVDDVLELRLAALFHDIGKPSVYNEDSNGIGHFYNHWLVSKEIFLVFASKHKIDDKKIDTISKLIYYHDKSIDKLDEREQSCLLKDFSKEELIMLFKLKRADVLAQNEEHHHLVYNYDRIENELLKKY